MLTDCQPSGSQRYAGTLIRIILRPGRSESEIQQQIHCAALAGWLPTRFETNKQYRLGHVYVLYANLVALSNTHNLIQ